MGIKSIHIILIFAACAIAIIFGLWGLNHEYSTLGYVSLILAIGLVFYGIQFIKKAKAL
jgi:hypothetical protein